MMKKRGVNNRSDIAGGSIEPAAPASRRGQDGIGDLGVRQPAKIPDMPDRPSRLWKDMPLEKRVLAAEAFWRDTDSPEIQAQHAEALVTVARRLNFRAKTVQGLSLERRARHLAHLSDVSDAIATRAMIAYHFSTKRPLMAAFLDALGIAHDDGLIKDEPLSPPAPQAVREAAEAVRARFDAGDVDLYLRTLLVLDGETWASVADLLEPSH
jgi:hypothetical protein